MSDICNVISAAIGGVRVAVANPSSDQANMSEHRTSLQHCPPHQLRILQLNALNTTKYANDQNAINQTSVQKDSKTTFEAFENLVKGPVPVSNISQLAAPRFASGINSTTGEQWAFDATSEDGNSGILIGIYHDPTYAFLGAGNLRLSVDAVWPNGSTWSFVDYLSHASVNVNERGTVGVWSKGDGLCSYSFHIAADNSFASLSFDAPRVNGSLILHSTVQARYWNGSTDASYFGMPSTAHAPAIDWVELIPAARAELSLDLGGTHLQWQGMGGMERWWGSLGWLDAFEGWRAMRAVVGPFVLTYWAPTSRLNSGVLYPSAFLARGGKRIFSATQNGPSLDRKEPYVEYRGFKADGSLVQASEDIPSNKHGAVRGFLITLVDPEEDLRWEFILDHKNMEFEFDLGDLNGGVAYVGTARGGQVGDDGFQGVFFNEWVDVTSLKVPDVYTAVASWYYKFHTRLFGF